MRVDFEKGAVVIEKMAKLGKSNERESDRSDLRGYRIGSRT